MVLAHNLPGWGRPGLVHAITNELGPHLELENDVNLAALGEQRVGVGKGVANFAFLQVGAGGGMGLILEGRLYRGATGAAGEIGYLPLDGAGGRTQDARRLGAFESEAAARGIVHAARAEGMTGPLDAKRVFAAARRGDPRAVRVVLQEARRIALALAAIVPVIDPELVILGGAVGRNGDLLLERVERELRTVSPFSPRIEVSPLGEEAVLQGAIALALAAARDRLLAGGAARAAGRTSHARIASVLTSNGERG
jgi:predicted NBD/HSP70 family sugar kinase